MTNQKVLIPTYPSPGGGANSLPLPNSMIATNGGDTYQILPVLEDGEIYVGSTGNPPEPSNITGTNGVVITNSPGGINIGIGSSPGPAITLQNAFDNGTGSITISLIKNLYFFDDNGNVINSFLNTGSTCRQNVIYYSVGNVNIDTNNLGSLIIPNGSSSQIINIYDETINGQYAINSCFEVLCDSTSGSIVSTNGSSSFVQGGNSLNLNQFDLVRFIRKSQNLWYYEIISTDQVPSSVNIVTVNGTSQLMSDNGTSNIYLLQNSSTTTFTLPVSPIKGHIFKIVGGGNGQWILNQNASQYVSFTLGGNPSSTTIGTGGSLSSTSTTDSIELVYNNFNQFVIVSQNSSDIIFV